MTLPSYAAIVLAGGRSERLGGLDKAMVEFAGSTLLDRVLDAVSDAQQITVVGPIRPVASRVTWAQEQPPGDGPVAAFGAGLEVTPSVGTVVLLATDLPFIGDAVPALLDALTPDTEVAVLKDADGRVNYLASAWRQDVIDAQLARIGDPAGLPMRRLFSDLTVAEVADAGGWGFDCDTPEALDIARRREGENTHD